jgi:hypothetical protein
VQNLPLGGRNIFLGMEHPCKGRRSPDMFATRAHGNGSTRFWLYDVVFFIALLATALALGAALAHALELPNKIGLPRDKYFVVQQIYAGWDRLAFLLIIELLAMLVLVFLARHEAYVPGLVGAAALCLLAAQSVFWAYTYPANVATTNWTIIPENWENLRRQWEYSHAAGAGFQLLAMGFLIAAALARRRV